MISLYYSKILYMIETENYVECLNTIYDKKHNVLNNEYNKFVIKPILLLAIEAYCLYKLNYDDIFFNILDEMLLINDFSINEQGQEFIGMIFVLGVFKLNILDNIKQDKSNAYINKLEYLKHIPLVKQTLNNLIEYNTIFNDWWLKEDKKIDYSREILYITEVIQSIFDNYFKKIYSNLKTFLI